MKEAFRLLNKSIIRVETPDVNLEQEDELEEEEQQQDEGNEKSNDCVTHHSSICIFPFLSVYMCFYILMCFCLCRGCHP